MIYLETPLTVDKIKQLKAGDEVFLSGTIYTGRDAAHKRLIQLLDEGKELPFNIQDQTIFYVGPTPSKPGQVFGSGGPTTSGRMDAYSPRLIKLGLHAMIGKGYRSDAVKKAIVDYHGVYFGAIGGAGAMMSSCIEECEVIAFDDLGPEAIRKLKVKNMPLVVVIDHLGNDLYEIGRKNYLKRIVSSIYIFYNSDTLIEVKKEMGLFKKKTDYSYYSSYSSSRRRLKVGRTVIAVIAAVVVILGIIIYFNFNRIQFLMKGYSWSTTSELVKSFDNDEEKELLSHDEMKHILKWIDNSNKVALYDEYEQFYSLHKDMNYEDIVDVVKLYFLKNQATFIKINGVIS